MGRDPRRFDEGCVYHLTTHGVDERAVFRTDDDRQDFVIRLHRVARQHRWQMDAYCLMDTHYHVLVGPGRISDGMRVLNGGYSRAFNRRHGRRGALFESRFFDREIRDERHLAQAIRYIEFNPVTAGIVTDIDDWPWRSRNGV
jgi:REP element-mobilizing transposase RayT